MLELDPSFRLGDEAELKLLKSDVAQDVMETYYASENRAFRDFVDRYANGKADQGIAERIVQLYDYSRGFPWPKYWLEKCLEAYSGQSGQSGACAVVSFSMQHLESVLSKYDSLLKEARALCLMPDGVEAYLPVIDADAEWQKSLFEAEDYTAAREVLQKVSWKRLPRVSASVDAEIRRACERTHADFKAEIEEIPMNAYFVQSSEELGRRNAIYLSVSQNADQNLFRPLRCSLKQQKQTGICWISLIWNMICCGFWQICSDDEGQMQVTPTSVADELFSAFYEEVVCDEYQDSNQVQELILSLLSRERNGQYNRFMVGDVKQRIYRFRLADAAIFYGQTSPLCR